MLPGLWNNHSHLGDLLPDEPLLRAAIRAGRNAMDALKAGFTTTRIAVMAGAESIEHGNDLSDDTIRMIAEAGTFLDPTIQCNLSTEFIAERERLIREAGYVDPPEVVEGRVRVSHADERTPERARMADRKATMVFFNTEEDLNEAMRSGLPGATDLSMQDLRANESPAVGRRGLHGPRHPRRRVRGDLAPDP